MQRTLSPQQIAAFYHKGFVEEQADHFKRLTIDRIQPAKVTVDIGGGCGYFATRISEAVGVKVRVIDLDPVSVSESLKHGIDAIVGDALDPPKSGDEGIVCFNLVLHHLVADTDRNTRRLQQEALRIWWGTGASLFVHEYNYESWWRGASGWLIYQITKSATLSTIGRGISRFVPSLRANTFGVGVRFRSNVEWQQLFRDSGFETVGEIRGTPERISWARRLLLIKVIRRDSFLLSPLERPPANKP